jgi:hypothetical protein
MAGSTGILSVRSFLTGSSPASINLLVYLSLYVALRANGLFYFMQT